MSWKTTDRIVGLGVLLYALVIYLLTVAPTASFWDCGEFIAIANKLEVSHPPGAPFYMLLGRLFSMFVPAAYVALSINLISVLASALTVLLAHLIIVRLVQEWQGPPASWTVGERITALAGGVVGACTFAVTDSFWFNAVEAEVYALSMFFTAVVVWLIMRWSEQARQEEAALAGGQHPFGLSSNRYLVLIAYVFGLAIGVHLLNLLAVFFIALVFFFTEFDRADWTYGKRWMGIIAAGAVSAAVFLLIYPGVVQVLPELARSSGAPLLSTIALVGLVAFGVYYTHKRQMPAANLIMLCFTVILTGYSTYALIFIRSAADPPIDENDPETTEAIVSYLKREQYGQTPRFKDATFDNRTGQVNPRNVKYFPRRHSLAPEHWQVYRQYDSDGEFFWKYQVGHMYLRYFLWNFVGKASDEQEAPAITGIKFIDNPERTDQYLYQTPSEKASRNAYFALPLLLGLFGVAYHFMRDWRRAFSVLILFLMTGLGIIMYLNQTPLQPRERDYSYVASFFAFSLWIGIGATGLLQLALEAFRQRAKLALSVQHGLLLGLGGVIFLAVPAWMLVENYFDHDRSGQYVAPDYAYNMLISTAENAVLFTNGDNDTFPLWYLQEVEGIRTDTRVANLSLLNTPWYVRQLKEQQSRESDPLPISLSEQQIENLNVVAWKPREVSLPVDTRQLLQSSEVGLSSADTSAIESPMTWKLEGRPYNDQFNILYAADQVVLDILQTNARQNWKRPVYFAVTVSRDGQLDLQNYFQLEGQAFRVVPIKADEMLGRVVPSITPARLREFKFTNLDNPAVYFDENIRRMVDNYRNIFAHTAESLIEEGDTERAQALLDTLMVRVPFDTIPGNERSFMMIARVYQELADQQQVKAIMQRTEPVVLHRLAHARTEREATYAAQYAQMVQYTYLDMGDYDAASAFSRQLADVLKDDTYRQTPEELKRIFENSHADAPEGDRSSGE